MDASEVRRRVCGDHERLRSELAQLDSLANQTLRESRGAIAELRADAEALLARLRAHMHWEESYLLPALREADAWGAERAERLVRDHREQCQLLDFAIARLRDAARPAALVARDVIGLVALLRADMREEEAELLDERVLRDDIVAIAMETG
jgi:hypothetical protein